MTQAEKMIDIMRQTIGRNDQESKKRFNEAQEWLNANPTEEVKALVTQFANERLQHVDEGIATIKQSIESEQYRLLPIGYIAEKYFHKSRSWLYQRLNGNTVRGKVYTLSTEQKATFNMAVQDIAKSIGSLRLS